MILFYHRLAQKKMQEGHMDIQLMSCDKYSTLISDLSIKGQQLPTSSSLYIFAMKADSEWSSNKRLHESFQFCSLISGLQLKLTGPKMLTRQLLSHSLCFRKLRADSLYGPLIHTHTHMHTHTHKPLACLYISFFCF